MSTPRHVLIARLCAYACAAIFLAALYGCSSEGYRSDNGSTISYRKEVTKPDGTVEVEVKNEEKRDTNNAHRNVLDADGVKGFFTALWDSEIFQTLLYGVGGGGGVVAVLGVLINRMTKKSTELKMERVAREREDAAFDEGAARKSEFR